MGFSPLARFRNFTLHNLKDILSVYPDLQGKITWKKAVDNIEYSLKGYKRTAYQQACQFGLENREMDIFQINSYLYLFDDDKLNEYLVFWFKTYYAPNPYVHSNDKAFIIYVEFAKKLLENNLELDFDDFFRTYIGGKSDDILLNAFKEFSNPLKFKKTSGNIFYLDDIDKKLLIDEIEFIETNFKIIDQNSKKEFFEKHNYEHFLKFNNFPIKTIDCDYNRIIYGIPGCGKSYYVDHKILENVDKNNNVIRTTFFLEYSNSDFIGQILPFVKDKNVIYKYVPGPFTKALEKAYKNTTEIFYLVIEEINRGNAAAIFGDLFQLLDRLKENSNSDERVKGDSEYPISNEFIEGYLKQEKVNFISGKIYIPHNLIIIATMNTSDQNVFPLDTAFKRRWKMERITNTWENHPFADHYIPFTDITWRTFVETINLQIISLSDDGLSLEDKQLGEYFADKEMFIEKKDDAYIVNDENKKKLKNFTDKVIEYLYNDVFKFNKDKLFKETTKSFDELCKSIIKFNEEKTKYIGTIETCMNVNFDVSNDKKIENITIGTTDEAAGE